MNQEEHLAIARLKGGRIMGYIKRVLLTMQYKVTNDVPTMAVDAKWRCYVNPRFLESTTPFGAAIILVHEGLHLMLDHPLRYKNLCESRGWGEEKQHQHARLWNTACDAIINNMIQLAGVTMPQWATHVGKNPDSGKPIGVFPADVGESAATINKLTSEELFLKLLNEKQEEEHEEQQQQQQGNDDSESEDESEDGSGGDDSQDETDGDGDGSGDGGEPDENSSEMFGGSCSDGLQRDYEDPDGTGNVSKPAADSIRKQVLAESKEWAQGRGFGSADMDIAWDELNEETVVDWTEVVSDFASAAGITARGLVDYAYNEPHHLQAVFVPVIASTEEPTPKVYVGVDTSGSMFSELAHTVNEAIAILDSTPNPTRWFTCDSVVTDHGEVSCADDIKLVGGGGTDLRDFFTHIENLMEEEGVMPDAVILFTDCETPWPDEPPPYECLIVDVRPEGYGNYPEWAESVVSCPKK